MKPKAKYAVGQVVNAWKGARIVKLASRHYRSKGDEFDGWWYTDKDDEQEYFECELRPLTNLERGDGRKGESIK